MFKQTWLKLTLVFLLFYLFDPLHCLPGARCDVLPIEWSLYGRHRISERNLTVHCLILTKMYGMIECQPSLGLRLKKYQ